MKYYVYCVQVVTGGWDRSANIYTIDGLHDSDVSNEPQTTNKRQKLGSIKLAVASNIQTIQPKLSLTNIHSDCITNVLMPIPNILYTASMDHTINQYDIHHQSSSDTPLSTIKCNNSINSIDYSVDLNLLVTAHNDNIIRIYDQRTSHDAVHSLKQELQSHTQWCNTVRWQNHINYNSNQLCSGSYDKSIKLWDIRSTVPLYTITSHTDKVLSLDWYQDNIISGGADNALQCHTTNVQQNKENV